MHDPRSLLDPSQDAVRRLARRGYTVDTGTVAELLDRRNAAVTAADQLRAESRRVAREVGTADSAELRATARGLKERLRVIDAEQAKLDGELRDLLLAVPNLPADDAPDGNSEQDAVEVDRSGPPPAFDFEPKDHVALGEAMGIFDFGRAAKLSGARFCVTRGAGAALERALATFFLHLHTTRHGYTEFSVPHLVTRPTMTGTGQLPKFTEDLFHTSVGDRDLVLIPTAEVPLTNLHADEVLPAEDLPYAYTAWTPCFRAEAGSYGRDTRGILRLHQFAKVELVRICRADDARAELSTMVAHARACLDQLNLAHRVVSLAAGDLGFSATFTYDIEVWLPSQNTYREVSSCSDCGTFQARRAGIRTKSRDGRRGLAATLNGSALPIGRTLAALLEQHQRPDGSVALPAALVPFAGFASLDPDGKPRP
jgi:seryl-tRNA synthetase